MGFEDDYEDDYEEEEGNGANRLFGFMFGNVDDSGDLDADYLDEEAREHLAAVADKLGTTFRDIHSSCSDAAEQDDYDEKAEDAVDYQDIDEQYEGPELQSEEDHLFPGKEYFSTVTAFGNTGSVFDDENYDEDDDDDLEDSDEVAEEDSFADELESEMLAAAGEKIDEDGLESSEFADELESEMLAADSSDSEEETFIEPLSVLCVEDGTEILRFSEIFGLSLKKVGNKDRKNPSPKEKFKTATIEEANAEDDEEAFLRRESSKNVFDVRREEQDYTLTSTDSGSSQFGAVDKEGSDCFRLSEPLAENLPPLGFNIPELYPHDHLSWEDDIAWDNSPAQHENKLNQHSMQLDFSIWGEPFGSCPSELAGPEKAFHPQLLRLDVENGTDSDRTLGDNSLRHFDKMMLQNRDFMEGSWMDDIIWEPDMPIMKPKLILDLQDEQMLFEISEENKHLMTHAGVMMVTRANARDLRRTSEGGFNISNDEDISKRKSSQQVKPNLKKHAALKKLQIMKKRTALKPKTMKAKPKRNKDIVANFNRQQKKQKQIDKEQDEVMLPKKSTDGVRNEKEKKSARESFVCGACGQPNHMRTNKLCPNKSGGQPKTSTKKLIQKADNKFTPEGKILKIKFKCGAAEIPATSDADTGNKAVKVNKINIIFPKKIKSEVMESHNPTNIDLKPPSELGKEEQPRKKIKIRIRQAKEISDVSQEGSFDIDEQALSKRKREEEEEDRRRFEEQRASHLQEQEILAGIRQFEEELSMDAEEERHRANKKRKKNIVLLNTIC